MHKTITTALLLCTGLIIAGCEKNYSVEDFKKDPKLLEEWATKCMISGNFNSTNCQNADKAYREVHKNDWPGASFVHEDEEKTEEKNKGN
ncbi:EexN family lipoprotein [Bartonella massiliensis]|uniref:EexN family lipoprotein n=1 Tax=Bartonella massiliensis TaxID=929795 RepID=UPI00115B2106|nr:EexN family lipoprotein [Bartonella massiliensis]